MNKKTNVFLSSSLTLPPSSLRSSLLFFAIVLYIARTLRMLFAEGHFYQRSSEQLKYSSLS